MSGHLRERCPGGAHPRLPFTLMRGNESPLAEEGGSTPTTALSVDGPARMNSSASSVGAAIERHVTTDDAASLASIDRPPSKEEYIPPLKIYSPYAPAVLALLMPASIFGVLARLGIEALVNYDGLSIFPLAWVQAFGCLFMGMFLRLKEPLGNLYDSSLHVAALLSDNHPSDSYGPLYTAFTTGKPSLCMHTALRPTEITKDSVAR